MADRSSQRALWRCEFPIMPKPKSVAFARIRAEVIRLVAAIPAGKFTTYGSIAVHMNVMARHVAFVLSRLTAEESATLPWHRVVGAEGRISPNMDAALARKQRARLRAEGMKIDRQGYIRNSDAHFHVVGPRRSIRWSHADSIRSAGARPTRRISSAPAASLSST